MNLLTGQTFTFGLQSAQANGSRSVLEQGVKFEGTLTAAKTIAMQRAQCVITGGPFRTLVATNDAAMQRPASGRLALILHKFYWRTAMRVPHDLATAPRLGRLI